MNSKLFSKDYALLWFGMAVSQLGDGAGAIGLLWWVQTNTGSAMLLASVAMVRTIVSVLLGPIGGAVADRVNKKAIIVLTDALRGLVYTALAYLVYTEQLTPTLLLSLVGVNAICSAFFGPAISSTVPLLVSKANLPRANSWNQMTSNLVSIIGYSAGGILVAFLGIPMLLTINAASFLLSACSEMLIHIPRLANKGKAAASNLLADIKEGFHYVRRNRVLIDIMKVAAVLNFVWAPTFILLPKFVEEHLGGTPALYGYLLAASMAGTLCASLLIAFTKVVERNLWSILYGVVIQAVLLVAMVLLPTQWSAAQIGIFLVMGLFNGIVNIYFGAIIQRTTAPEQMGRVWGLINTMSGGLQPVAQGITGVIGDRVALPIIYLCCGALQGVSGYRFSAIPNLRDFLASETEQAPRVASAEPSVAND